MAGTERRRQLLNLGWRQNPSLSEFERKLSFYLFGSQNSSSWWLLEVWMGFSIIIMIFHLLQVVLSRGRRQLLEPWGAAVAAVTFSPGWRRVRGQTKPGQAHHCPRADGRQQNGTKAEHTCSLIPLALSLRLGATLSSAELKSEYQRLPQTGESEKGFRGKCHESPKSIIYY